MGEVLDSDLSPKEKAEEFGRCGLLLLLSGMSLAGSLTMLSNPQMVRSSLETTKEMLRAKVTEIKQMARILTITNIESLIAYCEGCATEEAMVYLQEVAMEKNVHQLHQLANIVRKAYKEVGTVLRKDDLVAAVRNWKETGSVKEAVEFTIKWVKLGKGSDNSYSIKQGVSNGNNLLENIEYTDKVKAQMKLGDYHSFPEAVEAFGDLGKIKNIIGGDGIMRMKIEIEGSFMGKEGVFRFIIESDGVTCNHRLFVPNH